MSNIQALITSGILELYVLGLVTEEEAADIESNVSKYPELAQELENIKSALISYAEAHSVSPPQNLKETIVQSLQQQPAHKSNLKEQEVHRTSSQTFRNQVAEKPLNVSSVVLWITAFGFVLVIAAAYYFYQQASQAISSLKTEQEKSAMLNLSKDSINSRESELMRQFEFIRQKGMLLIPLKGTPKATNAFANIYYYAASRNAFLDPIDLPILSSGEHLYLWSITSGKVLGLGKINAKNETGLMQSFEGFDIPNSFIITLENADSVQSPNLNNIVLAGVVSKN